MPTKPNPGLATAIADFTAALDLYADFPDALYQRGIARRKHGQSAQATADIKRATELDKDIASKMAKIGIGPA